LYGGEVKLVKTRAAQQGFRISSLHFHQSPTIRGLYQ
jgi:hypothetical protein